MTRKTKDERLNLNRFPPLTQSQKSALLDAQFEQARRLRQGTYPADEAIAELKKDNNAHAPDPQLHQAKKLMARFEGSGIDKAKLLFEFADGWDHFAKAAWACAFGWLDRTETSVADYLTVLDLLIQNENGRKNWGIDSIPSVVERLRTIDPELGAAYYSRLSYDLYDRVTQDGLEKELEKFVERVRKAETTERDVNLVMAYFNLAIQLGDRNRAVTIASDASWKFPHERIDAYYRLWITRGGSGVSKLNDLSVDRLRELRDQCPPHFLFTAACQVAEMTGEDDDMKVALHEFVNRTDISTDEARAMSRAFLACTREKDLEFDKLVNLWNMYANLGHPMPGDIHGYEFERRLTIFLVEAYKSNVVPAGDLEMCAYAGKSENGIVLPSNLALIAEAFGDPAMGMSILERAYARTQDEELPIEERITALCRIARMKKKFAVEEGKTE